MKPLPNLHLLRNQRRAERGSMMLELMIAIVVLAIGMGGILILMTSAMYTNNRSGVDTSSTMIAEHIIEQIGAEQANSTAPLSITDCANNAWTIWTAGATYGGGSGANGGNGANLTAAGIVDWTESYASVPANYKMQYVDCGSAGRRITYDVRWNVVNITGNSRAIIVSARPLGSPTTGGLRFVVPANLRTIGGNL